MYRAQNMGINVKREKYCFVLMDIGWIVSEVIAVWIDIGMMKWIGQYLNVWCKLTVCGVYAICDL